VFSADVAKADRDVAYVVTIIHVCCKYMFPMFHLSFQTYVASVFIRMLQMFHTYVASVLSSLTYVCSFFKCFHVFLHVFQAHVSNASAISYVYCNCFIWMSQK
jgi:hypothetical protein